MPRRVTREIRRPAATDRGREEAGRSAWLRVKSLLDELPRSTRAGNMSSERRAGDGPGMPDQLTCGLPATAPRLNGTDGERPRTGQRPRFASQSLRRKT